VIRVNTETPCRFDRRLALPYCSRSKSSSGIALNFDQVMCLPWAGQRMTCLPDNRHHERTFGFPVQGRAEVQPAGLSRWRQANQIVDGRGDSCSTTSMFSTNVRTGSPASASCLGRGMLAIVEFSSPRLCAHGLGPPRMLPAGGHRHRPRSQPKTPAIKRFRQQPPPQARYPGMRSPRKRLGELS